MCVGKWYFFIDTTNFSTFSGVNRNVGQRVGEMPNLKLLLPDLGMLESLELPKHLSQMKLIFTYFVLFLTVAVLF